MSRFKPYYKRNQEKNASTSREQETVFKDQEPLVERLAIQVMRGRVTEEQAAEILCVDSLEAFNRYCVKWNITEIGKIKREMSHNQRILDDADLLGMEPQF